MIGAGVVGCATALALARRGVSVALLEAERAPGLAASGTNSGILHSGFDSAPGELETELISPVRNPAPTGAAGARGPGVVLRRGDDPHDDAQRAAVRALAENARCNGVPVSLSASGTLSVLARR